MAWERHWYRGNKVWILLDEAGRATLDDRGHAQLRYKPEDERTYTVRPAEIRPIDAGPDAGPDAASPPRKRPPIEVWVHTAPPNPDGQIGVGILLCWRDRRREITQQLPAASEDEIAVGAVLAALRAIRKPEWPVYVHHTAGERLEAIRGGAGTAPPACGDALREATSGFAELAIRTTATPAPSEAEHAARLAHDALLR